MDQSSNYQLASWLLLIILLSHSVKQLIIRQSFTLKCISPNEFNIPSHSLDMIKRSRKKDWFPIQSNVTLCLESLHNIKNTGGRIGEKVVWDHDVTITNESSSNFRRWTSLFLLLDSQPAIRRLVGSYCSDHVSHVLACVETSETRR